VRVFFIISCLFPLIVFGQKPKEWQHLDPEKDNVVGVSTFRAYELMQGKKSKPVLVAIIDNGVDLNHEDLQDQFWRNLGEIPQNGIDDDKDGYIDDINGWNFLGNQKGENIKREQTELSRIYSSLHKKYGDSLKSNLMKADSAGFNHYLKIKTLFEKSVKDKSEEISNYKSMFKYYLYADSLIKLRYPDHQYSQLNLFRLKDTSKKVIQARDFLLDMAEFDLDSQKLSRLIKDNQEDLETRLNPDFNIRSKIVGDNPEDLNDSIYGNNMVNAQNPYHGTGVAGNIGALYNGKGVNGIAKDVRLMIIRALPNGDENDKDVALAIRYAVRHNADIISCSFGKSYSMHPEFVEQAIREAEKAGVLIVHAAGNDGRNNDSVPTYPTGYYSDGKRAANWLSVGASTSEDKSGLVAYFSNYGKASVDVFAPGYELPSCILGNKYDLASGTSTAAPVVSGIAAVLKSYFPELKATELRDIIIKSVYIPKTKLVKLPGNADKLVNFSELSVSGGIANLYRALLLAQSKKQN
jgi:cell wall-associated protease